MESLERGNAVKGWGAKRPRLHEALAQEDGVPLEGVGAAAPLNLSTRSVSESSSAAQRETTMFDSMKSIVGYLGRYQFDQFRAYVAHMEERFERDKREFDERFEEQTKDIPESARAGLGEWYAEGFTDIGETFPRIFWRNSLVSLWSQFEHEMVGLCRLDFDHEPSGAWKKFKISDKIRYFADAVKHLESRQVAIPASVTELTEIGRVRNQIAHDEGKRFIAFPGEEPDEKEVATYKRSKQVDEYVESRINAGRSGLSFDSDVLMVTPDFCREVADLCQEFFSESLEKMPVTPESYQWVEELRRRHGAK